MVNLSDCHDDLLSSVCNPTRYQNTQLGRTYYKSVYGADYVDFSFGYADEFGLMFIAFCDNSNKEILSHCDAPIDLWLRPNLPLKMVQKTMANMYGQLGEITKKHGMHHYHMRTFKDKTLEDGIASRLLQRRISPVSSFEAYANLHDSEDELLASMRSGHRQQVKWGIKNLRLICYEAGSGNREMVSYYQNLHAEVSGRITRPAESWDVMFKHIDDGHGDLILSYLDDRLVGGTLVLDAINSAYYASGAYVRELFDKPLSHAPIYQSMLNAKKRGNSMIILGEVGQMDPDMPKKELSIGWFKAGFSSTVRSSLVWKVPVAS